jgi:hypothetical protein
MSILFFLAKVLFSRERHEGEREEDEERECSLIAWRQTTKKR